MTAQLIAETVSERLVLKAYSTATYDAVSEPAPATDPAATGGQVWRHTDSFKMALAKTAYSPKEIRIDQQQPIDKLGSKSLSVSVSTLLSCLTHKTPLEAVIGGTWTVAAVTSDNTTLISVAADSTTSKFTFAGGDTIAAGFFVGDIVRFTNLSEATDNTANYVITGIGGTSNREWTVYPPPATMTADTSFTITTVGRSLIAPETAPVARKFAIEEYQSGPDIARLGTEIRFGGFDLKAAPNALATLDFTGTGRNLVLYSGVNAPFFTSPTAQTTTDVISSMDGLLLIGSVAMPVTGLSISFQRSLSAAVQIKADGLAAGVVASDNAVISGDFSLWMTDTAAEAAYLAATEFAILAYLPASNAANTPAMTFYLPRCIKTSADPASSGGSKSVACKYSAGRPSTPGIGVADTALRIVDTEVT